MRSARHFGDLCRVARCSAVCPSLSFSFQLALFDSISFRQRKLPCRHGNEGDKYRLQTDSNEYWQVNSLSYTLGVSIFYQRLIRGLHGYIGSEGNHRDNPPPICFLRKVYFLALTLCAAQCIAARPPMSFRLTSAPAFINSSAHSNRSPRTQNMSGVRPNLSPVSISRALAGRKNILYQQASRFLFVIV